MPNVSLHLNTLMSIQPSLRKQVRVIFIYHPTTSSLTSFLDELSAYLSEVVVIQCNILITGDFNIHFELNSAPGVEKLRQILEERGLQQNVMLPTHKRGHTLDLVISRISNPIVYNVAIERS